MQKESMQKIIILGVAILLGILSFAIVKPYLVAIMSAGILAYISLPLQLWLEKKMPKKIAAIFTVSLVVLIILIPLSIIPVQLISQSANAVQDGTAESLLKQLENSPLIQKYNIHLDEIAKKILSTVVNSLSQITLSIISTLVNLAITLFAMYYMLLESNNAGAKIKQFIPFKNKEVWLKDIAKTTKQIVYGTLIIALIELCIASVGFYIAGVNYFLLFATAIALFAFIPGGPGIIWIPLALVKIFISHSYLSAVIVIITGILLSFIDTVIRAKIVGDKARIDPVTAIVGLLGGTLIFGAMGLILGPLILSYTMKLISQIIKENS